MTESLDAGGMDEFVAFLARGLHARGLAAAVLTAPVSDRPSFGGIEAALRADGIETFDGSSDRAAAEAWASGWRPDVVAVHGEAVWPLDFARRHGIPAALVLHGVHDLLGQTETEIAARARLVDLVICVSEGVREYYLQVCGQIDPARVMTIPNGIDATRTAGIDRSTARDALGLSGQFLFVSLARHALQKNTYALVSAFDDVAARVPEAHLLVCGRADDPAYAQQVVSLRGRLLARDRIHLRAGTTRVDVLLAAADAFVLDSFFEGWALSSMEALAAGVPVISSDVGGAREQLAGAMRRGVLVGHPLGDPARVDWPSMGRSRFALQQNRSELVEAMVAVAENRADIVDGAQIAADAVVRFDAAECIDRHARALIALSRDNSASREVRHDRVA